MFRYRDGGSTYTDYATRKEAEVSRKRQNGGTITKVQIGTWDEIYENAVNSPDE